MPATTEEELFAAAETLVRLRDKRAAEIVQAGEAKSAYDTEHGEAVGADDEMANALDDFRAKANDYQKPADPIP